MSCAVTKRRAAGATGRRHRRGVRGAAVSSAGGWAARTGGSWGLARLGRAGSGARGCARGRGRLDGCAHSSRVPPPHAHLMPSGSGVQGARHQGADHCWPESGTEGAPEVGHVPGRSWMHRAAAWLNPEQLLHCAGDVRCAGGLPSGVINNNTSPRGVTVRAVQLVRAAQLPGLHTAPASGSCTRRHVEVGHTHGANRWSWVARRGERMAVSLGALRFARPRCWAACACRVVSSRAGGANAGGRGEAKGRLRSALHPAARAGLSTAQPSPSPTGSTAPRASSASSRCRPSVPPAAQRAQPTRPRRAVCRWVDEQPSQIAGRGLGARAHAAILPRLQRVLPRAATAEDAAAATNGAVSSHADPSVLQFEELSDIIR